MINTRKTKKQIQTAKFNDNKMVVYLTSAKHVVDRIKKDKTILQKKNPRWTSISNYINYVMLRDFGKQTILEREQELKDIIKQEREELKKSVGEHNRTIDFFLKELSIFQTTNATALGILKLPVHDED